MSDIVQNVQQCAGTVGNSNPTENTKKYCNPASKWCFTHNNYSEDDISDICTNCAVQNWKYIFQEEKSKTGTPHLQGYINFTKRIRPKLLFKNTTIHWEACRGTEEQNITYCSKPTFEGARKWTNIQIRATLDTIQELWPWQQSIYDMCTPKPDKRTINWIYDPVGNNGKTELCKYLFVKLNCLSATSGSAKDIACMLACAVENGRNLNELTIFLFHYSRSSENISYKAIESVKDGYITSTKYKSNTLVFNNPHVFILSNQKPELDKLTIDRWKIWTIRERILWPIPINELALC